MNREGEDSLDEDEWRLLYNHKVDQIDKEHNGFIQWLDNKHPDANISIKELKNEEKKYVDEVNTLMANKLIDDWVEGYNKEYAERYPKKYEQWKKDHPKAYKKKK